MSHDILLAPMWLNIRVGVTFCFVVVVNRLLTGTLFNNVVFRAIVVSFGIVMFPENLRINNKF